MVQAFPTTLHEARTFAPDVFEDERGWFKETYAQRKYAELGVHDVFVQDSVSRSRRGVLRGMHGDRRMSKLVQCLAGTIYDVIVDLRPDSPTYRRWEGFELSADNHRQLYVPAGFAHGFLALDDEVIVSYKQSEHHDPQHEFGLRFDDPAIGIAWPLAPAIVSAKDRAWPPLG